LGFRRRLRHSASPIFRAGTFCPAPRTTGSSWRTGTRNPHVVMATVSGRVIMAADVAAVVAGMARICLVSFENRLPSVLCIPEDRGTAGVSAQAGVNHAPRGSPTARRLALTLSTRERDLDIYLIGFDHSGADPHHRTNPGSPRAAVVEGRPQPYFTSDRAAVLKTKPRRCSSGRIAAPHFSRAVLRRRPRLSPDLSHWPSSPGDGGYHIATMDLRWRGRVPSAHPRVHFDVSPSCS